MEQDEIRVLNENALVSSKRKKPSNAIIPAKKVKNKKKSLKKGVNNEEGD